MWLFRQLTSTTCALIFGAAARAWHSSPTQRKRDLMASSSWTWRPARAGVDFMTTPLPIVEGRPFLEHQSNGSVKQGAGMGSDGIAISSDGMRLYYCPLGSRKLYSV